MESSDKISKRWLTSNSLLSALLGRNAMLLLLAWVGGSTDAVSYLGLGHVFTKPAQDAPVFQVGEE